jgi:hypothetical protein
MVSYHFAMLKPHGWLFNIVIYLTTGCHVYSTHVRLFTFHLGGGAWLV